MGMTLKEAASVLGISVDASKADINAVYRSAVSKYHPDANRNKPDSEKKRAEEMFKKVSVARKVLLNPETADPDIADFMPADTTSAYTPPKPQPHSQSSSTQTAQRSTQPRPQSSYRASAASSQYSPQGHATSRSFTDDVPRVVDPAEEVLQQIYRDEAKESYRTFADKLRATPSMIVSAFFLLLSILIFVMNPAGFIGGIISSPAALILAVVSLVKLGIYDLFASYYVDKALSKKLSFGWLAQCGGETIVMSVIAIVLLSGNAIPAFALYALFGSAIVSVGLLIAAFIKKTQSGKGDLGKAQIA